MGERIRPGQRRRIRREQLWPGSEDRVWPPQDTTGGWAKISRIVPLVLTAIDKSGLRKKSEDVARTYIELLCRNMDVGFVEVPDEDEAAVMTGFSGNRRVRTWRDRVFALQRLHLIEIDVVGGRKIGAILMLDPREALEWMRREKKILDPLWKLVQKRYSEVLSIDIGDPAAEPAKVVPLSASKKRRREVRA